MIEIHCNYKYFHVCRPPPRILQNDSKKDPKMATSKIEFRSISCGTLILEGFGTEKGPK